MRIFFVNSLTQITKYFIYSAYDNIVKGQNVTYDQQNGRIDIEKAKKDAIDILTNKEPFSIEKIKPSMVLMNDDGDSLSIIRTCSKSSAEFKLLNSIYKMDLTNKDNDLTDFSDFTTRKFLEEIKKVLNILNPIDDSDTKSPRIIGEGENERELKNLNELVKSYVFTSDNFIKLILIYLRIRANIPVILLGETGSGKTALIRIMAKLKDITMHILNIHAGIEDNDIIQFLREKDLFEGNNKEKVNDNNEVWVFLDEINTCNSLGLISEIMLKHSCNGEKIKSNIRFLAASNPYRLDTSEKEIIGLYDEKLYKSRKLVYNVHPLPHSLLNFIFDFGSPSSEDIKKYILNMISEILQEVIKEKNILNKILPIAEKLLFDSHEYIKNNYDVSSVSLREIRRVGILYKWFSEKFFKNKYINIKMNLNDVKIYLYSLNLSIYLCYYIRIFNKNKRKEFLKLMNESSKLIKQSFGIKFKFERIPKEIQNIIASEVELEEGIAKNKALLENLFAIFVCINTKIPLFIIGKPGN
eukprot:jgi/Orpsp1_1/1185481/evm.model.c7180000093977.2